MAEKSEALLLCEKMPEAIKTQFIRVTLEEVRKFKAQPGGKERLDAITAERKRREREKAEKAGAVNG